MSISTSGRLALIERNTAEILGRDELVQALETGRPLKHYIGFEISGQIHLGTGLICMAKIKDLIDAGVECTIFLADWHTWINEKLGGDLEVIRRIAVDYFAEGLKASLLCLGGDPSKLNFVLGTELYHHNDTHWNTLVEVSKNTSLARIQRSITIMGRKEGEQVDFAKLIYPVLQVADIFSLRADIAHAGIDQRKAHVIARDVGLQLKANPLHDPKGDVVKPIALHHPLILGLRKPPIWPIPEGKSQDLLSNMKMSKSDPGSAIFIHDSPELIRKKIAKAFCPPGEVIFNPVLDWLNKLVFGIGNKPLRVERTAENGGEIVFETYQELEEAFLNESLHPMDAKQALATWLIEILAPARDHFASGAPQKALAELENLTNRLH